MKYDPECDECVEGWESVRARLADVVEGKPYEGTYCVTNLRADIRAALQRDREQTRDLAIARAAMDEEGRIVAALRQRVSELEAKRPLAESEFMLMAKRLDEARQRVSELEREKEYWRTGRVESETRLLGRAEAAEAKLARVRHMILEPDRAVYTLEESKARERLRADLLLWFDTYVAAKGGE